MDWKLLTSTEQIPGILDRSHVIPQIIFKHSIRCGTSSVVKNRLERSGNQNQLEFILLDVISNRSVSNKVAEDLNVWHESPQILVIVKGECVYDESHLGITMEEIRTSASS